MPPPAAAAGGLARLCSAPPSRPRPCTPTLADPGPVAEQVTGEGWGRCSGGSSQGSVLGGSDLERASHAQQGGWSPSWALGAWEEGPRAEFQDSNCQVPRASEDGKVLRWEQGPLGRAGPTRGCPALKLLTLGGGGEHAQAGWSPHPRLRITLRQPGPGPGDFSECGRRSSALPKPHGENTIDFLLFIYL